MTNAEFDCACVVLARIVQRSQVRHRILLLLAAGMSRKMIAHLLGRSRHTVDDHLKIVYRKTGLRDRVLLAAAVRRVCPSPTPSLFFADTGYVLPETGPRERGSLKREEDAVPPPPQLGD